MRKHMQRKNDTILLIFVVVFSEMRAFQTDNKLQDDWHLYQCQFRIIIIRQFLQSNNDQCCSLHFKTDHFESESQESSPSPSHRKWWLDLTCYFENLSHLTVSSLSWTLNLKESVKKVTDWQIHYSVGTLISKCLTGHHEDNCPCTQVRECTVRSK